LFGFSLIGIKIYEGGGVNDRRDGCQILDQISVEDALFVFVQGCGGECKGRV
jgi:hypothetical protein